MRDNVFSRSVVSPNVDIPNSMVILSPLLISISNYH
ncbi:hypothetical protein D3856_00845 [Streptococcus mutans]|nr:hypothetical protein [Streptococcus mutans]NLQ73770.1 hypothetical protein [Streptococcus mutans]NLQ83573.1 hypothetical protein [Streptococcus mutans]